MKAANSRHVLQEVKKLKTSDIRKSIPKECYKRSLFKAILWGGLDLCVFLFGMFMVFSTHLFELKIIGSLIAGVGVSMMFIWAHDAAHGTLFKRMKIAEILGTIFMLPSLNIYRMWSYGHNKVHHGFTSYAPIDWIWRPLTPAQYNELSFFQRVLYRIERSFFGCAFHYLRRIWWEAMLQFNPGKDKKQRRHFRNGKLMVLVYAIIASTAAYFFAGGIIGILTAVIVPFIVFNYFVSLAIYLHHTHPDIPFADVKSEWSHSVGALYCTTIIKCTKFSSIILHNIMTHVPHHLDARIPFYHLPRAYQALRKEYGEYIHEYQFKWSDVYRIFKKCKLYDFENNVWMSFKEAGSCPQQNLAAA